VANDVIERYRGEIDDARERDRRYHQHMIERVRKDQQHKRERENRGTMQER